MLWERCRTRRHGRREELVELRAELDAQVRQARCAAEHEYILPAPIEGHFLGRGRSSGRRGEGGLGHARGSYQARFLRRFVGLVGLGITGVGAVEATLVPGREFLTAMGTALQLLRYFMVRHRPKAGNFQSLLIENYLPCCWFPLEM